MYRRQFLLTAVATAATAFHPLDGLAGPGRAASGYIRTNWSRDPYSFGSYSFTAKGAEREHHAILGRPIDARLFFAGEATHPSYNSTVHAAYESGLMAADAVARTDARSIVVVGGGMSGLTAASQLARQGYDVTIWEARDRIGGRIWTDKGLGVPLDLGASWIHGDDGNPLAELAAELDLETTVTRDSYIARGGDGREVSPDEEPDWLEEVLSVQHDWGAGLERINMRAYRRDTDYSGEDLLLPNGYAEIFKAVSDKIDIHLNRNVQLVRLTQKGVEVTDTRSEKTMSDAVIVTVPLGVLKQGSIEFSPPLPTEKNNAIRRLGMGVLDKLYLKYEEVFWDSDKTWIATPENGLPPGQFNQWLNLYPYIGEPIIVAFNGAEPAKVLAALSDAEVVRRAQNTLNSAYP